LSSRYVKYREADSRISPGRSADDNQTPTSLSASGNGSGFRRIP
jgi:hypothetical protein